MTTRKIWNFVTDEGGALSRLSEQCSLLVRLDARFRNVVPAPLRGNVRLASVQTDRVTIEAESSAWLTRLRFQLPQIRILLSRELQLPGRRVELRVRSTPVRVEHPTRKPHMSDAAAQLILQSARAIDDPALTPALERLARRRLTR